MEGHYEPIGGRSTYFPPFVNELFGKKPYWACTFASLLNGANVAWLGEKEASSDEIQRLARASGDPELHHGSTSRYMVSAMKALYDKSISVNHFPRDTVVDKLQHGWVLVAGIWYADLPDANKVWSKKFNKGHRVAVVGWDNGRTRLLDPMLDRDHSYAGQWIKWLDFEKAWWSGEQVWFKEGQWASSKPLTVTLQRFKQNRRWTVKGGTLVTAYAADDPREVAKKGRVKRDSGASFDAWIEVRLPHGDAAPVGRYIRVVDGWFKGLYIDPLAPGITADTNA